MSGYLDFKYTGVREIDNIIDQLEYAGNAYHHTAYWDDEAFGHPGKTHKELIQEALEKAANAYLLRCSGP
jgi:hypothetical protein